MPVMANLADPRTRLNRSSARLADRGAAIVAPAAETQAALFGNLDTTFTAIVASPGRSCRESDRRGPAALDAAIEGFPTQRAVPREHAGFFRELRPGAAALRTAAPATSPTHSRSGRRRCAARWPSTTA